MLRRSDMKIAAAIAISFAVLAVLSIPASRDRSHQKQTLSDMRTIATAWEARANDFKTYEIAASVRQKMETIRHRDLRHALVPTYIKVLPARDGWDHPFQFASSQSDYFIRSTGRDTRVDHYSGVATSFDNDVVYSNGTFIEYPEGL